MKLCVANLQEYKEYNIEEKVDFPKEKYASEYIRNISQVDVKANYRMEDDYLIVSVKIKGVATLACAYTLEDVEKKFTCSDDIVFTDNKELEDENTIYFDRNEIILDDILLSLVVACLPMKVTKKDAKLPDNGKGYRVLSEEEFQKERANKKTSPFDVLNDIDLDK